MTMTTCEHMEKTNIAHVVCIDAESVWCIEKWNVACSVWFTVKCEYVWMFNDEKANFLKKAKLCLQANWWNAHAISMDVCNVCEKLLLHIL